MSLSALYVVSLRIAVFIKGVNRSPHTIVHTYREKVPYREIRPLRCLFSSEST